MRIRVTSVLRQLQIQPHHRIVIDGVAHRSTGPVPNGWKFRPIDDPNKTVILAQNMLDDMITWGRAYIEEDLSEFDRMVRLALWQRDKTFLSFFWCAACEEALEEGLVDQLDGAAFAVVNERKAASVASNFRRYRESADFDHGKPRRKARGGEVNPNARRNTADIDNEKLIYHEKTLGRIYRKWAAKRDLMDLVPESKSHGGGGPKTSTATVAFVAANLLQFSTESRASIPSVTRQINALIDGENEALGETLKMPHATAYQVSKAIDLLPASQKLGGRLGKKRMRARLGHVGRGPTYRRVGEMVLHDCWDVHVETVIDESLHHLFTPEQLAARVVLAASLEAGSGCFVGFTIGTTESANLVTQALRMTVSDKNGIARAAGCLSSWHMRLAQEEGRSDAGSAYRSTKFLYAAMTIGYRFTYAAAGRAHLRGLLERIFRMLDENFIRAFLSGGTFGDVVDKGEYKAEQRAAVFITIFCRMLVRFIVDVYHHTAPTRGGLSPCMSYDLKAETYGQRRLPNRDEERLAFGFTIERDLTRMGIRFHDIPYYAEWLDPVLRAEGPGPRYVVVDPEDLGGVSVLIGMDWVTLSGPPEFRGVRLEDWIEYKRELRAAWGPAQAIEFREVVAPALRNLADEARKGREFFGIRDFDWTPEKAADYERELRTYVVYDRTPVGAEPGLSGNSRQLGTAHVRGGAATSPASIPGVEAPPPASPAAGPLVPEPAPKPTRRAKRVLPRRKP